MNRTDIVVCGAGIVGLSTALALSQKKQNVTIIAHRYVDKPTYNDEYGSRIYAISASSQKFLERIGCWSNIPIGRLTAVIGMEIYGDAYSSMLDLSSWQSSVSQLSWIVEASEIERSLVKELIDLGVSWIDDRCSGYSDGIMITEGGKRISADLFIGADGSRSTLRDLAGVARSVKDYNEISLIANICAHGSHRSKAFQWFGEHGILALLPLPNLSFGNQLSMVWSTNQDIINCLNDINIDQQKSYIEKKLNEITCQRLGCLKIVSNEISRFNLTLERSSFIAHGMAFVGDAAHRLHPLAGQGLNLGLGDAESLCDILLSKAPNQNFGDIELLNKYSRIRSRQVSRMYFVTDALHKIFSSRFPLIKLARNYGLSFLNKAFFLKPIIVKFASKN
ncbi:FAD-dependent monooxygenase [Candidatus Kinetoplastidibacterium blastocrithidiae]|uniref:FAD-dependent monooxygenase n=1 Tax=Candidatus Kinetoplastidibacterium blastocrithidiae TaxID=233181 RepID=UPI0005A1782B|nr:FAD-dependent monooxygenase [Candidatus Kinetoplastibacterium blastocrithidii]